MKNENILRAIGEIDDDLITDAVNDTKKKKIWLKWGSLAAALLVLSIGAGIFSAHALNNGNPDTDILNAGNTNDEMLNSGNPNDEILSADNTNPDIPDTDMPGNEEILVAANSIVILDVNPSIALTVNTEDKIVSAEGLNEDGNIVLDEMDLVGVDMTVAVNAIIGSMLQKGYLSDLQNAILVSVENEDAEASAALQARISSIIGNALKGGNLDGSVLSQTLNDTTDLEQMAQTYQISLGKAALIQEVMAQDETLTIEKLAPLSITEIALISQSKNLSSDALTQNGAASDKAYISQEAALGIAYAYANVKAEDATGIEVEFDSHNGIMVYEIEFYVGTVEYEYHIDARTGEVVKYETDGYDHTGNPGQHHTGTQNPSDGQQSYIGEDAAKKAALADAGIDASTVTYINAWLDYDDGYPEHYEVEFTVGNLQYEYEIDLYSGAVLEKEVENYSSHHDSYDNHHTDDYHSSGSHH